MRYKQLTLQERYQIKCLQKIGFSISFIAKRLNRHKSTISREVRRNTGLRGYRAKQAHQIAVMRRISHIKVRISYGLWQEVRRLISEGWSPEQISGRIKGEQGESISVEWIYHYIYKDKARGGELYKHLRCKKERRKRYGSYSRRGKIANKISIDERPAIVEERGRATDWEGDTMVGKRHKGAVLTLVNRKSLFTLIAPLGKRSAENTATKIINMLKQYQPNVDSITVDNGLEFAYHESISKELKTRVYFARPNSPWQRGLNENTNGLIRQYLPKSRELIDITKEETRDIMLRLNNRPRKRLEFKTPYEVFYNNNYKLTNSVALTS